MSCRIETQTETTSWSCRCWQLHSLSTGKSDCCSSHQPYIALVSWEVPCLQTRPDAWLHGTDTAPSGSSPPPRRGRRILGVLTGTKDSKVRSQQHQAEQLGRCAFLMMHFFGFVLFFFTFVASVRMSLESLTRHCSGTVTSMTFALSCLLLLSVTNLPYQALRMMRPGFFLRSGSRQRKSSKTKTHYCVTLMCSKIPHHFFNWAKAIPLCWIYSPLY